MSNPLLRAPPWMARRLGIAATNAGRHQEAIDLLREAVSMRPACAMNRANLSVALERRARETVDPAGCQSLLEEAIAESMEAAWLLPKSVSVLSNLGLMLENAGHIVMAERCYARVIRLAPRSAAAAWARAGALVKLERWSEASEWYARVLELKPGLDVAACNLVSTLSSAGRNAEALRVSHAALRRTPGSALAWSNAGCVLRRLGRNREALDCYDHALSLDPRLATAAWARSLCLLALGYIRPGWDAYEWGLKTGDRQPVRQLPQPVWDGTNPVGSTVLVWMEQGLGDQILWASMLPDLMAVGMHVVVECEYRLVTLFQRSFPEVEVVPQTAPLQARILAPDIDCQIPAGSLPRILRPYVESFPLRHDSYLVPDPARVDEWKWRMADLGPGLKVGVSWRSLKTQGTRAMDCMRLSQWGPILTIPGIHWINLQCGWTADELAETAGLFDVPLHVWDGLDLKDHQDELAALISNLDLVVTAFTVVAQLAGALGVPCWVLNHLGNQSWFSLGTDHCPWQPSIRFFPCGAMEPWDTAIETLAAELRSKLCG